MHLDPEILRDQAFKLELTANFLYSLADAAEAEDRGYTPDPPSKPVNTVKVAQSKPDREFDIRYRVPDGVSYEETLKKAQSDVRKGRRVKIEFPDDNREDIVLP